MQSRSRSLTVIFLLLVRLGIARPRILIPGLARVEPKYESSSVSLRELVELVADAPRRLPAGLRAQLHVRFRAQRGADRPEHELRERPVALDPHAGAGLAAIDADVVVLRGVREARELPEHALALLELARELD